MEQEKHDPHILFFIKFFSEEIHAEQFLNGRLFLNRLSYFKTIEADVGDGRPDRTEAVAMWWQPHDLVMDLHVAGIGDVKITNDDLAGPVAMSFVQTEFLHLLCLHAVQVRGIFDADGKPTITEAQIPELRKQLTVDERCFTFGKFAAITQAVPFLERTKAALIHKKIAATGKLIGYYDEETFHGEIARRDIPFKKQKRFSYQSEFRICVNTGTEGVDPLVVEIGDLRDICAKVNTAEINDMFATAKFGFIAAEEADKSAQTSSIVS